MLIDFHLNLETIEAQGIRFRLYANERFKREKILAEGTVMFASANLDEDMCKIVPLERVLLSKVEEVKNEHNSFAPLLNTFLS